MANGTLESNADVGARRRRLLITIVVVLVLFVLAGLLWSARPRRIRITVTHATREDIASAVTTNGRVEPIHNFEAHAPAAIAVKKVFVKPGQLVRRGQLLAMLDDADAHERLARAEASLRTAQAKLANMQQGGTKQELLNRANDLARATQDLQTAERNLAALQNLQKEGAASPDEVVAAQNRVERARNDKHLLEAPSTARVTPQDLARAESDVASAQAEVAAARQLISFVEVRAPFDGTVYLLPVKDGQWMSTGDTLLMLADLTQMQVRAFVDEPEIGRVALGEQVRVTWDALPGRTWQGTVSSVPSTVVARGSRMVGEVLCSVDNHDRRLLPDTNVTVVIVRSGHEHALTLPREALHQDKGQPYVFVLESNTLHRRDVQTGISSLTRTEILSGLHGDETVGLASLSPGPMEDGITVKVVENPLR